MNFAKPAPASLLRGRRLFLSAFCWVLLNVLTAVGESRTAVKIEDAFPKLIFKSPVDFQSLGVRDPTSAELFIVEQAGIIRSFRNDVSTEQTIPFLDIRDRVDSAASERGLLGLAFDPEFKSNRRFFVNYTRKPDGATVIARFEANTASPAVGLPSTEKILMTVRQPYANHNGGGLAFGPDGFLYIALGDGGAGGDPHGNGQNKKTLLGKILRIDVKGDGYSIPPSNPFYGEGDGVHGEIYAYGLRNPWRISFDAKTGELWTADVGQNKYEEIDLITSGGNYGWNTVEGNACYSSLLCNRAGLIPPLHVYGRGEGQSVTGGFVYRGTAIPELTGRYIFGDFVTGKVWALPKNEPAKLLLESKKMISSFGVDNNNELYLLSYREGKIFRLIK